MIVPTNPRGKRFTWSYTALTQFETCPNQYAAQRYWEQTKQEDTEATIWGKRVHKALEDYVRDGVPLAEDFKPYKKWADTIICMPGEVSCELQFCINTDCEVVDWFAEDAWGRGVIDLLKVNGKEAFIGDWKTGKVKNDETQLKLFAYFTSLLHPEIEWYNCRNMWLKFDTATGFKMHRDELPAVWDGIRSRVNKVMQCWELQNFPCSPSGLCRGWCANQECLHWQPKRERR